MDFNYVGRFYFEDGVPTFGWSSSVIEFNINGSDLVLDMESCGEEIFFNLYVDRKFYTTFSVPKGRHHIQVINDLPVERYNIVIERRNELFLGLSKFYGISRGSTAKIMPITPQKKFLIEFIGDSLTAGYGVESDSPKESFKASTEDSSKSYAGVASSILGVDYSIVAFSGKGAYRDYEGVIEKNLPYYYSLISENPMVKWDFLKVPDLIVINLGANDFARGIPDRKEFIASYLGITRQIIEGYGSVPILLVGGMEQDSQHIVINREYIDEIFNTLQESGVKVFKVFIPPKDSGITRGADDHPAYLQQLIYGKILANEVKKLGLY